MKEKWITNETMSKRMSKVKTKRNKPERALAKALFHAGIRYRLNDEELPGKPDIVITKFHIAIFVDGEFWHGKDFENQKKDFKSNKELWINKIEKNINHDEKMNRKLEQMGWTVIRFWGKDIIQDPIYCVNTVLDFIDLQAQKEEGAL